jgi:hypothetical protein
MLCLENGEPFATGVMNYEFRPVPPGDRNLRIFLLINIGDVLSFAVLDTGAPYLIIAPGTADQLGLNPDINIGETVVSIRGVSYQGYLDRINIKLPALHGAGLTFEATAFIVKATDVEKWGDLPTFLGIECCLDRIRFAIDPKQEDPLFYFGALP